MFPNKPSVNISTNKLFTGINFSTLNLTISSKEVKKFKEGEIIFKSEDESKYLYLIIDGAVKIKVAGDSGNTVITNKNKDDFFGEIELLSNSQRKSSVVALKKTKLYRISLNQLKELAETDPKIKDNLKNFSTYEDTLENMEVPKNDFSDISDINLSDVDNYTDEFFEAEQIRSAIEKKFDSSDSNKEGKDEIDFSFEDNEFKLMKDEIVESLTKGKNAEILNKKSDKNVKEKAEAEKKESQETENLELTGEPAENPNPKEASEENKMDNFDNKIVDQKSLPKVENGSSSTKEIIKFLSDNIKSSNFMISSYLDAIDKKELSNETNLILSEISFQNNLIKNIIKIVSDFSIGENKLKTKDVNFNDAMNVILQRLAEYCDFRNVELFKKIDADALVNLDENSFYQACFQIVKNGCDAVNEDGKIYVMSSKNDDEIILEFKDNGRGIDESIKGQIFEPFITHGKKGAGLGLAIAKKIVNNNGGKISAKSSPENGTTITISLPVIK